MIMIFWRVNPLTEVSLAGLHTRCVALAEDGRIGLEVLPGHRLCSRIDPPGDNNSLRS